VVDLNANTNRHYIKALSDLSGIKDRLQRLRYSKEKNEGVLVSVNRQLDSVRFAINNLQANGSIVSIAEFKKMRQTEKSLINETERLDVEIRYSVTWIGKLEIELIQTERQVAYLERTVLELRKC
jgi:hypothetical protein